MARGLSLAFPSFPFSGVHVEEKLAWPGLGGGDAPRKLPKRVEVSDRQVVCLGRVSTSVGILGKWAQISSFRSRG